jgi:RND family efflux transporter MFP subunit
MTGVRSRWLGLAVLLAVVLAGATVALLLARQHRRLDAEAARRRRELARGPRVYVAPVRLQPGERELVVPADVRGFLQATIYAKVAGYVKSMAIDKGDSVRKDQVLGLLISPELDQQVAAAQADVIIRRRTYERYRQLVGRDFVSAQDFETVRSQYEVSVATLRQARALQKYKVLRAPFAGTVTGRYVDPGSLIPAATGSTASAQPLVDVADLRRLRITMFVQQDAAWFVEVGDAVTIRVDDRPDLKITAAISRVSKSLDPRSRAMWCEVWLDNHWGLYPGAFVHVTLRSKAPTLPVVPSTALVWHDEQINVAVIRGSRVHFIPVRTGIDNGRTVQVSGDVQPGEPVALNLPAEIAEGALVQPLEQPERGEPPRARTPPPRR